MENSLKNLMRNLAFKEAQEKLFGFFFSYEFSHFRFYHPFFYPQGRVTQERFTALVTTAGDKNSTREIKRSRLPRKKKLGYQI